MRPKKVVLLVDVNEMTQSTMRFLLETKGYRVVSASTGEAALQIGAFEAINLIILRDCERTAAFSALAVSLKDMGEGAPLLFVSRYKQGQADDPFYDVIVFKQASPSELMERVKMLAQKKPGPKAGSRRKPVCSVVLDDQLDKLRGCA